MGIRLAEKKKNFRREKKTIANEERVAMGDQTNTIFAIDPETFEINVKDSVPSMSPD